MSFIYEYHMPAVTVDAVVFDSHLDLHEPKVLLIQRGGEPYKGLWALPGGFASGDETLQASAERELLEETGLKCNLSQLRTFGAPGRDPRGWTVSVMYWGMANSEFDALTAGDDADNAGWWDINKLPELAFDHKEMIEHAYQHYLENWHV